MGLGDKVADLGNCTINLELQEMLSEFHARPARVAIDPVRGGAGGHFVSPDPATVGVDRHQFGGIGQTGMLAR